MANPLDALYFREAFGRTLRRPDRGSDQAYVVAPFMEGQTKQEMRNVVSIVRNSLIRCIDYGDVHYVSAEMCSVLQYWIDHYMQDRTIFHLDQGDLPSLTGFVYFDGHIQVPTIYSSTGFQDLRAVLWDQFAAGPPNANSMFANRPGLYFGGSEGDTPVEVIGKVIYTVCDTPDRPKAQRERFGPWKARHWIPAHFGVRFDATMVNSWQEPVGLHDPLTAKDMEQDSADSQAAMLIVFKLITAWTRIIQTEIPVKHPKPESYDKVMHKEGRPPADVKVTLLRRYSDTPPHGLAEVDWAYRWDVKGHYRNQRVGPGRQFIRKVWVPKYIKGPKDKPYVPRDSVTALVR